MQWRDRADTSQQPGRAGHTQPGGDSTTGGQGEDSEETVSCVKRIARDTTRLVLTNKPLHALTFNDFQLLQMPRVSLHNFASLFSRERAEPRAPWVPPPRGRLRRPAAARLCWPVVGVCLCWPGECPQPQHSRVSPARSVVRHSGPGGRAGPRAGGRCSVAR